MSDLPADEDEPVAFPEAVIWPIVRLKFERRMIVYEDGTQDHEEWDGEDWVSVDDD